MKKYKIYVDGSFNKDDSKVHGGVVFWSPEHDSFISAVHVETSLPEMTSMNNVGGEVIAAWSALVSTINAITQNYDEGEIYEIELVYDYEGVGKWLTGEWKCRKHATQWYRESIMKMLNNLPNVIVKYTWVRGHGAVLGNEYADSVAAWDKVYCNANNIPIVDMTDLIKQNMGR